MNEIGPVETPDFSQATSGGQADTKLGIAGNRHTGQPHLAAGDALGFTVAGRFVPLSRTDNRDAVAAQSQTVHDAAQRHGDAVYFGSVGFSDESKVQVSVCPFGGQTIRCAAAFCLAIVSKLRRSGDNPVNVPENIYGHIQKNELRNPLGTF